MKVNVLDKTGLRKVKIDTTWETRDFFTTPHMQTVETFFL